MLCNHRLRSDIVAGGIVACGIVACGSPTPKGCSLGVGAARHGFIALMRAYAGLCGLMLRGLVLRAWSFIEGERADVCNCFGSSDVHFDACVSVGGVRREVGHGNGKLESR